MLIRSVAVGLSFEECNFIFPLWSLTLIKMVAPIGAVVIHKVGGATHRIVRQI